MAMKPGTISMKSEDASIRNKYAMEASFKLSTFLRYIRRDNHIRVENSKEILYHRRLRDYQVYSLVVDHRRLRDYQV